MAQRDANGVTWGCKSCGGRAVGIARLRKTANDAFVREAWRCGVTTSQPSGRACPICTKGMQFVSVEVPHGQLALDLCRRCEFIWFDPSEYERVPPAPPPPTAPGDFDLSFLPPEARAKAALAMAKEIADCEKDCNPQPDEEWKTLPAFLGFPVELDSSPIAGFPWATWTLAGLITAVSGVAFFRLHKIVWEWGLIPTESWRHYGLTFVSSFFLHGDIFHLLGNLYFLLVFGRPVENFIGPWRWLLLIFVAAFAGDLLHVLGDPNGTRPCVGASGGISALIIFYALKFPHARIGLLWRFGYIYRWIRLSAWTALALWLLLQVWGVYRQLSGYSSVSALAHFGGVAIGILGWLAWRNLDTKALPDRGLVKVVG